MGVGDEPAAPAPAPAPAPAAEPVVLPKKQAAKPAAKPKAKPAAEPVAVAVAVVEQAPPCMPWVQGGFSAGCTFSTGLLPVAGFRLLPAGSAPCSVPVASASAASTGPAAQPPQPCEYVAWDSQPPAPKARQGKARQGKGAARSGAAGVPVLESSGSWAATIHTKDDSDEFEDAVADELTIQAQHLIEDERKGNHSSVEPNDLQPAPAGGYERQALPNEGTYLLKQMPAQGRGGFFGNFFMCCESGEGREAPEAA